MVRQRDQKGPFFSIQFFLVWNFNSKFPRWLLLVSVPGITGKFPWFQLLGNSLNNPFINDK